MLLQSLGKNQAVTGNGDHFVRPAQADDVPAVVRLVHDLAAYEQARGDCNLTETQLADALFAPSPALYGHVAIRDDAIAGCALWFLNFSTWRGVHGIYVEDIYVVPDLRGQGLGRALMRELATICSERGYGRLEWAVLDWNEPAISFYRSLGAEPQDQWRTFRLSEEALERLGHG